MTDFSGGVVFVRSFNGWIDLGLADGWRRSWVWVMVVDEKGRYREEQREEIK